MKRDAKYIRINEMKSKKPNVYSIGYYDYHKIPEETYIFSYYYLQGKAEEDHAKGTDVVVANIATFGENLAWMQTNDDIYDVNLYFDKDKPPVECLVIQGRLLKDTVRWASRRGGMICYENDVELFKDILNNFKWKEHNYLTLNAIMKRHTNNEREKIS